MNVKFATAQFEFYSLEPLDGWHRLARHFSGQRQILFVLNSLQQTPSLYDTELLYYRPIPDYWGATLYISLYVT